MLCVQRSLGGPSETELPFQVGRNLASHQQPGREVAGGVWVLCALPVPPAVSLTGGAATPTGLVSRVWLER